MPWEKGVSTTQCIVGKPAFMSCATLNASLSARHTYHEVDVHCPQHLIGFLGGAHLRECGRITQSQLHILVVNFLLHTPVVLKHKGIVGVGYDENIVDAAHHQIDKRDIFQIKLAVFLWYHWLFSFLFL